MPFGSASPGARLQRRMVVLTMISSTINILLIVPFLLRTLDWTNDQWTVLWWALAFWIPALALISHRLQGSVRELARWLDLEAAGKATRADEVRAFGGSIALVRETLVNSYLLWPVGAACISLTTKWLTAETTWTDVGALCAAGGLGAAVSTPTVAWVFRREVDPYRARLARIVDDPDQRERAVRRLSIGWKLQSTVLFTSAVPILVMMLVTHRQIGLIAGEFAHAQQREWLEADEPENLASSTHAPFGALGGGWWLLDPATGRIVAQSRPDLTGDPRAALAGREEASGEGANGEAYYAWQRNVRGDRVLVTMLPRSALAHFTSPGFEIPALIALSLTIAFAAAWIVSRDLSSGIAALRLEADRITKGDLQRATVYESEDELGALGRDFDRMRQSLRETVGRVASAADRVDDAAGALARIGASVAEAAAHQERGVAQACESTDTVREQASGITRSAQALSSSVEESSSSILEMGAAGEQLNQTASALSGRVDEVSSSVEEMVRGVAEMARHVESLAEAATDTQSSISEMAGSMRDVDANAAETARLSAQVVAVAEGGRERVQQTIAGMEAIRDATDTVEKVIRGLGERAREIGAIVDVIDDVADETNLLALNAAIIAAQAGEHGRAFSVVADEIKELADRVMASTKEIGSLIRGVQSESEAAVAAIERGAESVWTGVERSAEAGESLEAITRTARESGSRIAEIVQAVQEQTRAASHVQALMERVRVGVDQLRNATHEQEQGHEIVLRGTTGMRDAAQQVHRTTEEQTRGSNQIRQGIEVVRSAVEQIHRALQDQSEACEQSARFMGQISSRARTNHEAAGELSQGAEALRAAAQAMRENIERFRI